MNIHGLRVGLSLRQACILLLVFFSILSAIYFSLILKADDNGQLLMSVLFYLCLAGFLIDKSRCIVLGFDMLSALIGVGLCIWVLFQARTAPNDYIVRLFPFISGLATSLIAVSWRGLKQIKKELCLLFFLGVPSVFCYYFVDISLLTARMSAFMLWYSGQHIWTEGLSIGVIGGKSITVVYDCSGIDMVNYFLALSVLCLIQYPLRNRQRGLWVPIVGIIIGFIVNCLRVVMLVLFNNFDQAAFKNWHTGTGSYLFAMLGVLTLGGFYWLLLSHDMPDGHRKNSI